MSKNRFFDADNGKKYFSNGLISMPGGFFVYKADWDKEEILYANQDLFDIFECENEEEFKEFTGGSFKGIVHPDDYDYVEKSLYAQIYESEDFFVQAHYRIITKKGNVKYIEDYGRFSNDPVDGAIFYVFVSAAHVKIDPLTGLPNRKFFLQQANKEKQNALEKGYKIVVVAFDIVDMKGFNSKFGMDEGDRLLCRFADILSEFYGNKHCGRFGEDHFYSVAKKDGIEDTIKTINKRVEECISGVEVYIRVGISECEPNISAEAACDRAKQASDTINNSSASSMVWYDEKISEHLSRREYILNHIDEAISKAWIEPYYQPVFRTLTKRLCNFEALARWIDPERGMISPGDFIPVLEENGLSYKLDMYIVSRVVSMLQGRIRQGLPIVPVSVNFSRSDFLYCDLVEFLCKTCDSHNVRRELICIEITETALMTDTGFIKEIIDRFHKEGFEVWMDDFGSGYSSLNVLKDFEFDEIKLDMDFLKNVNEKSKTIVTMAVRMAKSLTIHTLAEGVETKDHFEFLKSIGCERLQGYYFGKPMPLAEVVEHIKKNNIEFESREISALYQKTGLVDIAKNSPIALAFYDKEKKFKIIYVTDSFQREISRNGEKIDILKEGKLNPDDSIIDSHFMVLVEKVLNTKKRENMTLVSDSQYYNLSLQIVAQSSEGYMMEVSVDGRVYEEQKRNFERDAVIRTFMSVYNSVYIIDFENDTRTVIISDVPGENEGDVVQGVHEFYKNYLPKGIYEDDIERWREFCSKEYILKKAKETGKGFFSEIFCIKRDDGSYHWDEIIIVDIKKDDEWQCILVGVKESAIESQKDKAAVIKRIIDYNYLKVDESRDLGNYIWLSLMDFGNLKFFWKDKERRFLGASRAFYDYYGFKSKYDILGKTDEDMGWHLNDTPFKNDELRVLTKGDIIRVAANTNVVDGIAHNIIANKFPIYKDNKIIGLVGYFVDVEEEICGQKCLRDEVVKDTVTGLMNAQGFMVTLMELDNNYTINDENYIYVSISVSGYDEFNKNYGQKSGDELLCEIARIIKDFFGDIAVISRNAGAMFSACARNIDFDKVYNLLNRCKEEIESIRSIEGKNCQLHVSYGTAAGSEADDFQNVIDIANRRHKFGQGGWNGLNNYEVILPDQYKDLPVPYLVVYPKMNGEKVKDMVFIFANRVYCQMTGKSRSNLIGKGYMELFPKSDFKWVELTYRASKGEYIHLKIYDGSTNHWVSMTAAPSSISGACSVICDVIDEERKKQQPFYGDTATNDAIIEIAKILDGEDDIISAINQTVEMMGKVSNSDISFVIKNIEEKSADFFVWIKEELKCVNESINCEYVEIIKSLTKNSIAVVENIEQLKKEFPDFYDYLKERDVSGFVTALIMSKGKIIGLVGFCDCRNSGEIDIKKYLESVSYFLASKMRFDREEMVIQQDKIGYKDSQTKDALQLDDTVLQVCDDYDNKKIINSVLCKMDLYKDIPIAYAIYKPLYDEEKDIITDVKFIFVNEWFCKLCEKSSKDFIGHTYLEVFKGGDVSWFKIVYDTAIRGKKKYYIHIYSKEINHWLEMSAEPLSIKGYVAMTFAKVDRYVESYEQVKKDWTTGDVILKVVETLNGEEDYEKVMNLTLEKISQFICADRIYVIEKGEQNQHNIYEWCDEGVSSKKGIFTNLSSDYFATWDYLSYRENVVLITDAGELEEFDKKNYHDMIYENISCILAVPLFNNDKIIGYLAADNFELYETFDVRKVLETVASFISSKIIARQEYRLLKYESCHDPVTGLLNKKGLDIYIREYIEKNPDTSSVAVIIDIDNFKMMNDLLGLRAGDMTLVEFSKKLVKYFDKGAILGRNVGDEFYIFLKDVNIEEVAEKIKNLWREKQSFIYNDREYVFSVSIGYALYPKQALTYTALFAKAGAALYYGKRSSLKHGCNMYSDEIEKINREQLRFATNDMMLNMPGAVLVYRAKGEEKILYANDCMVKLFECESFDEFMEFTKGHFKGVVDSEDYEETKLNIWNQINSGTTDLVYVDYRIRTKNGKVKHVCDNGRFVHNQYFGSIFYMVIIDKDERAPHIKNNS
ncbi:diguanylate cyclase (GGDEF) domain-containing protein [Acetitomaculum ruminis DSM 5522]|uniref:Diguanylate cyclase (GGDEF) domain-containing protein n=1 Tax=Acetitomaculum ruminis DSM 5522 TaxID=1120918 RepID=A0A1I0WMG2_9FIRM|nr:EAL domain-containing protein [Acetitomaculum ruminis]SFA89146.1 diguanylate cyclase (GGDEF) domain-containing protein [Acetitomaculum ruminis DSM 5522]